MKMYADPDPGLIFYSVEKQFFLNNIFAHPECSSIQVQTVMQKVCVHSQERSQKII